MPLIMNVLPSRLFPRLRQKADTFVPAQLARNLDSFIVFVKSVPVSPLN